MEKQKENIYLKIFVNILIYIVGLLLLVFIVPRVIGFFLPFIIAWIIAWIANPLVQFLERRFKLIRKHSSVLIIFLVIALIALLLYGISRFAISQISLLIDEFPNIVSILSGTFNQVGETLSQALSDLSPAVQEPLLQLGDNFRESFNAFIANLRLPEATLGFTRSLGDYLLFIITLFISAYFFIRDRDTLIQKIKNLTPASVLEKYELIKLQFNHAILGYISAQFKIMIVVIIILYIGFKVIDAPYAFLIALLTGFVDILPIFGTGFVLWPWMLVELILGNYLDAVILFALYLICQLVKNILQPKLVADSVGLNPLTTLIFMYVGYQFAGLLGLILSIPAGMILINLYNIGMFENIIRGFGILIRDVNNYRKF